MTQPMHAIIMAGGMGKRMKSTIPKVLNTICGEPMILCIIKKVLSLDVEKMYIVCGKFKDDIKGCVDHCNVLSKHPGIKIEYVNQLVPQGTGDAIKCCLPYLPKHDVDVLILNGDTPLIDSSLDDFVQNTSPCLMVTSLDNPTGQGRIICSSQGGSFLEIVEEKDATDDQKNVQLVNCGVYLISSTDLQHHIPLISNNNAQSEFYLTDICGMLKDKMSLYELQSSKQNELVNVNTCQDLNNAERILCQTFFKQNNLIFRCLKETDYYKGYLDLMKQLSDTVTISSFVEFKEILSAINMNTDHNVYVLEDTISGSIVASITLLCEQKFIRGGKSAIHIEDVVVENVYRGRNIGVQLLRYVNTLVYDMNAYKVILDCKEGLEKFYKMSGFTKTSIQMSKYAL